ncbi:hypothetical protein B0T18DRAFT_399451 [Schizothecium vesticola]|uniref:Uncharacterized protein n=1 Tax=Schizothecium vesticola TaxID=314040 RepID=A0AA40FB60_9PEZI|nr:hypothetical protein B0T18DRAFT_399451 [Schizothecium vesticola]
MMRFSRWLAFVLETPSSRLGGFCSVVTRLEPGAKADRKIIQSTDLLSRGSCRARFFSPPPISTTARTGQDGGHLESFPFDIRHSTCVLEPMFRMDKNGANR